VLFIAYGVDELNVLFRKVTHVYRISVIYLMCVGPCIIVKTEE